MGIEKKMKRGELFQFPKTMAKGGAGVHSTGCVEQNIGDSAKPNRSASRQRQVAQGSNAAKAHRNFIWLPWMEGAVNYAEQQGKDVLSGPFSGCYMIRYRHGGATWRVAHVHTPGAIPAWNALAAQNGFEISCGFKPYVRKVDEGNFDKWYGIVSDDGLCFRVWAGETEYGIDPTVGLRRIKEVKMVSSIPPANLRVLTAMA